MRKVDLQKKQIDFDLVEEDDANAKGGRRRPKDNKPKGKENQGKGKPSRRR